MTTYPMTTYPYACNRKEEDYYRVMHYLAAGLQVLGAEDEAQRALHELFNRKAAERKAQLAETH